MHVWTYKCVECDYRAELAPYQPTGCPSCGTPMRRDWRAGAPQVRLGFREHWNPSVGQRVRSDREFREALKRKSEENFLATGFESNYVPFDGDAAAAGVKGDVEEITARREESLGVRTR